jgi:hypothetical protein
MPGTRSARATSSAPSRQLHEDEDVALNAQPLACIDALARTAEECHRQRERLSRLIGRNVGRAELTAAHAIADTCDLALEECVSSYESGDLLFAYELEASALLALRHACTNFFKVRPDAA